MKKNPTKTPMISSATTIIFLCLTLVSLHSCISDRPVDYVDPFNCTEGDHGQWLPAALVPFALVELGISLLSLENARKNLYIQSASLNGKPFTRSYITHDEIVNGGKLIINMGNEPYKNWRI